MIPANDIEVIPLEEWCYAWRIMQYDQPLSLSDREQIRPLSEESSTRLADAIKTMGVHRDFPFSEGLFSRIEKIALSPTEHQDELLNENRRIKKWLYQRRIPLNAPVLLSYDASNAVLTTWKMLVQHWRLFYYPMSDDLTVGDESQNWCLFFFHEEELYFGAKIKLFQKVKNNPEELPSGSPGLPSTPCNAFLEAISLLNQGCDHGTTYSLDLLPQGKSIDESLASYFAFLSAFEAPQLSAEDWHIRSVELQGDWQEHLEPVVRNWFFQQLFSPKLDELQQNAILSRFFEYLQTAVGEAKAFKVTTEPPVWYECAWNDFAFESKGNRWILHFGVSD